MRRYAREAWPASANCAKRPSELSVRRIACESGLRLTALPASALAEGVEVAGVVTFLDAVSDGQIVTL